MKKITEEVLMAGGVLVIMYGTWVLNNSLIVIAIGGILLAVGVKISMKNE